MVATIDSSMHCSAATCMSGIQTHPCSHDASTASTFNLNLRKLPPWYSYRDDRNEGLEDFFSMQKCNGHTVYIAVQ